jgi:prepilin-type N-terminal cleavage/methylation domain-containing protein
MTKHHQNSEKGFTLVEMAIVIAIIGVLVGAAFSLINPLSRSMRETGTKAKMERVADALASYAQRHKRLPCPAPPDYTDNPAAYEMLGAMWSDSSGDPDCVSDFSRQKGIVPYRTLGIAEDDVRDGWGHYFTYAVTGGLTDPSSGTDHVHSNCRTSDWIQGGSNVAIRKARFCCMTRTPASRFSPDRDIAVHTAWSVSQDSEDDRTVPLRSDDHYSNPDNIGTYEDENISFVAYVLISHGQNGYGRYLTSFDNPTDARYIDTTLVGDAEAQNASVTTPSGNNPWQFADLPRNEQQGAGYFDDIVFWRTQEAVMYEFGNDSCAMP